MYFLYMAGYKGVNGQYVHDTHMQCKSHTHAHGTSRQQKIMMTFTFTCSSAERAVNRGIRSDFRYSGSTTLANSPSFPAAARRTIGVSSPHRFRKCLKANQKYKLLKSLRLQKRFTDLEQFGDNQKPVNNNYVGEYNCHLWMSQQVSFHAYSYITSQISYFILEKMSITVTNLSHQLELNVRNNVSM